MHAFSRAAPPQFSHTPEPSTKLLLRSTTKGCARPRILSSCVLWPTRSRLSRSRIQYVCKHMLCAMLGANMLVRASSSRGPLALCGRRVEWRGVVSSLGASRRVSVRAPAWPRAASASAARPPRLGEVARVLLEQHPRARRVRPSPVVPGQRAVADVAAEAVLAQEGIQRRFDGRHVAVISPPAARQSCERENRAIPLCACWLL